MTPAKPEVASWKAEGTLLVVQKDAELYSQTLMLCCKMIEMRRWKFETTHKDIKLTCITKKSKVRNRGDDVLFLIMILCCLFQRSPVGVNWNKRL